MNGRDDGAKLQELLAFRLRSIEQLTHSGGFLFFAAFSQTHITASLYDASRPKLLQPWSMPLRHCQFNFVYK